MKYDPSLKPKNKDKGFLLRETNKDEKVFEELQKFYKLDGMSPKEFFDFLTEFKNLRGDYGLRQNKELEEKLYPNIIKLSKEMNAKRAQSQDKPSKSTKKENRIQPGKKLDKHRIAELMKMEEDSDEVIEEPMNHIAMANRADIMSKYSLDK